MKNQTEVRPVVSGSVMKLQEYLLYVTCTGFHVLYAYKQIPEVMDQCLIWMLTCGIAMAAVMLLMKNDIWQQSIIITLATVTTFVVGYWVHTMEFGITIYLVMGVMVAWLQNPVLNIICSVEGLLAMILAYVFCKDVILERVSGLFYITMTIIGTFAMASICYMVIRYRNQVDFIEEQKQSLIQAQKSKDTFFANMSHEIRTPMNAVVGMCELILQESNLSDTVRENAVGIRNSGKLDYAQETYSLSSVINDVVAMAMVRKGRKPIEVLVDCDSEVPRLLIGDEIRIRQIITNLMGNAVKFTEEGRIKLTLRSERSSTGVILRVAVSDTGIGIREEDQKLLFESFSRLDTKKNSSVEGTELGLAITKRLIEGMNGELALTSKYGEGSEFSFFIPQGVAEWEPIVHLKHSKRSYHLLLIPDLKRISSEFVRTEYGELLEHLLEQLGVRGYMVVDEKTRQQQIVSILEQDPEADYTHIFISGYEYQANGQLYDRLAEEIQVCIVIERDTVFHGSKNIRIIYKPLYLLTLAAILNGESVTGLETTVENESFYRFEAIDEKVGLSYFANQREDYEDILKIFYEGGQKKQIAIQDAYETGNMQAYMIQVHALKSTAMNIGAVQLSGMAKNQEAAARAFRREEVIKNHDNMMEEYQLVLQDIKRCCG